MNNQPLHLKYRPQTWDDFIGNASQVANLRSVLAKPNRPHSFLLSGPSGCGKTTLGRLIAMELGASGMDLREINAANYRGIDTVRNMIRGASNRPWGVAKVFLLDEAGQISVDAQYAMLKLLEEPFEFAYFVFCTTDPGKLILPLIGRCIHIVLNPLRHKLIIEQLTHISDTEGFNISNKTLSNISQKTSGSLRNAIMLLEQVTEFGDSSELFDTESFEPASLRKHSPRKATLPQRQLSKEIIRAIGPTAFVFLTYLLERESVDARANGWFTRSVSEVQSDIGLARSAQRTARRKLIDIGVIEQNREGIGHKHRFKINHAFLDSEPINY